MWDVRLKLVLMMGEGSYQEIKECTELVHLADYSQPHAPSANVYLCFPVVVPVFKGLLY